MSNQDAQVAQRLAAIRERMAWIREHNAGGEWQRPDPQEWQDIDYLLSLVDTERVEARKEEVTARAYESDLAAVQGAEAERQRNPDDAPCVGQGHNAGFCHQCRRYYD